MNFDAENDGEGFSHPAEISAIGQRGAERTFLLRIFARHWELRPSQIRKLESQPAAAGAARAGAVAIRAKFPYRDELLRYLQKSEKTISFIEYVVKAYLYTDRLVTNAGKAYREAIPVGSYGYVVRHSGQTEYWDFRIEGAERINDTTYLLRVAGGNVRKVTDYVQAVQPPKWSLGLQGAAAFPLASLRASYGNGAGVVADATYHFDRNNALQGRLGYFCLPAAGATASAWQLGSAGLCFLRSCNLADWFRPYLSAGFGGLLDAAGAVKPAGLVGAGVDLAPWRSMHLRLGSEALLTTSEAVIQAGCGLLFRLLRR
jgi:hypothetical protein